MEASAQLTHETEHPPGVDLAAARGRILAAIGDSCDLTVVRGIGNRGDELITAGTRALLREHIYREIDLDELCAATGETVLLPGSGGFCRPYHEVMPRALAVAEQRFSRVIVLPSSLDPSEETVRAALSRSRALVFAREPESLRAIESLCRAELAHDLALWADLTPWQQPGRGTLNAFRTDPESAGRMPLPADNDDISVTAPDLESWLARIAAHEGVRTDRAHVMIAAARLGKRVEFAAGAYFKVPAIAAHSLAGYDVVPIPLPRRAAPRRPPARPRPAPPDTGVTAVVLTRDRPAAAHRAVESLLAGDPVPHVVLLDNHSSAEAATELRERWADVEGVDLLRSDRNLGCGGGRQHVIDRSEGELVLLLDDDAVLHAGALEILRRDLEAHPGAVAVTATVQRPDGVICHSGGTLHIAGGVAEFGLVGGMQPAGDPLPPSGLAGWVPGTAALIRRSALERFPLDAGMRAYYEDNEWCWRVSSALAQPFRRSVEARATHFITTRHPPGLDFSSRSRAIRLLNAHAHFYRRHGLLLNGGLFALVPELVDAHGERDIPGARLVMELLAARGPDWTFAEWMNGGLAPALGGARRLSDARRAVAARDDELARARADVERLTDEVAVQGAAATEHARVRTDQAALIEHLAARNATLERIEQGGWWRLRTRLLPLLRLLAALRRMAGR